MTGKRPLDKKTIMKAHGVALVIPLCVLICFGLVHDSDAQEAPPVALTQTPAKITTDTAEKKKVIAPVSISTQGSATRVIFDMPGLTPYVVHKTADGAHFVFRTNAQLGNAKGTSPLVKGVSAAANEDGGSAVDITFAPGTSYKHYRLQKKIIVEIVNTKTATKDAAAPENVKPAPKPAEKPTAAPAQKTEAVKPETVPQAEVATTPPAPTVTKQEGPAVTAAPVTPVTAMAAEQVDTTPTHIRLDTLEPVRLAVFTRFNTLWFVVDTTSAALQPPTISGPLAARLGSAKVTTFDGGIAFRYTLPPETFLTARKENMAWDINLTAAPLQAPSDVVPTIEFDQEKPKLILPLKGASRVLQITDPEAGDTLSVIATNEPPARVDQARHFTNLDIMPAAVGMAAVTLADDVRINRIQDFVLITAPDGIIATPPSVSGPSLTLPDDKANDTVLEQRLFDFPNWRQGGLPRLYQNITTLQNQIAAADSPDIKNELMMKMALVYFANNMGQETMGILRLLEENNPELFRNPNALALRGVASAMANHYTEALSDLTNPALQQNPEAKLWIGTVAAATEQWQMANREFPKDNRLLVNYPENIAVPITIYMAESALRLGHASDAQSLLDTLKAMPSAMDTHNGAAIAYLRGEIARQEGRDDDAIRIWKDVSAGIDRLYHTKSSLALSELQLQQKQITPQQAVDAVDSLRFAWRGDGLEVQIVHKLGLMKAQAGKFLEGLQDLKSASLLADSLMQDTDPIKSDILRIFTSVFDPNTPTPVSPIEAVSVYNEFNNLVPTGDAGTELRLRAADFMISIDLLGKAAGIIDGLLNNGLIPADKIANTGAKLAAVYLLDDKPEAAIAALEKTAASAMDDAGKEKRALLMARAQSQMGNAHEAIQTLSTYFSPDAQKLKTDVLWKARKWNEAGETLLSLLPPTDTAKLTDDQAQMIINAAVACKLAGNAPCLQNIRAGYAAAMAGTKMGTTFTVITREGAVASLADRETMLRIAGEADLFKQFLDSYKSGTSPAPSGQ